MIEKTLKEEDEATYLCVTFDKRLTWKPHTLRTERKARKKLAIMRKLAGTTWGANEQILKTVYEGSVRPVLDQLAKCGAQEEQPSTSILLLSGFQRCLDDGGLFLVMDAG